MSNTVRVSFDRGETFTEIILESTSAVFNDTLFETIIPEGKTIDYATLMYPEDGDDRVEDAALDQEIEIVDGMRFIISLKNKPEEVTPEEPAFEDPMTEPVSGNDPHPQFESNTFISQQYNREDYLDDENKFIIPFIAMNDGYTPAQIRSEPTGLFRDVQRSPFLRKKGIISKNNTIPDIDITPLVRYGTLEQARIAPTLENIEVRLFIREPNIKKVPSHQKDSPFADKYIWREIPAGFHVYNNDTVYGFEWMVLQDDYSGTDGVYNLHMNIEDGLGICKFAGTQAPIALKDVEYKLIVVAKNLWNREYSLLDDQPLAKSLEAYSDVMAPTVTAVKKFYERLVETEMVKALGLKAGNGQLEVDDKGVFADTLNVNNFTIKDKTIVFEEDLDAHKEDLVDNPALDPDGKAVGVHGIKNTGFDGNIQAHSLDGAVLSNGAEAITEDVAKGSYIPFVDENNSIGLGTTTNFFSKKESVPKKVAENVLTAFPTTLLNSYKVTDTNMNKLINQFIVGSSILNSIISKDENNVVNFELKEGNQYTGNVNFKSHSAEFTEVDIGGLTLNYTVLQNLLNNSSITKKIVISEKLPVNVKDGLETTILVPNKNAIDGQGNEISIDADGNIVEPLDTKDTIDEYELKVEDFEAQPDEEGLKALTKLGSALQALQELPLSTWIYKRGQEEYKQQIGILVERVNQVRDKLRDLKGTDDEVNGTPADTNFLVHKRNTLIKSSHDNVLGKDEGINASNELVNNNTYTYTEEEIKSIANYLNLTTSKKELQQEIRNTVGILLKAAQETQERLLNIETSVFGFDSPTVPGNDENRKNFLNSHIAEELQEQLNAGPLLLGLNRLMRAICLELFDTTDLEEVDAETQSLLSDSDTLGTRVTVKTRMDRVDEIINDLTNRHHALTSYYLENISNDEGKHTYTPIVNKDGEAIEKRFEDNEADNPDVDSTSVEKEKLLDGLNDNHAETSDYDEGHAWSHLSSPEDIANKGNVPFGQIAEGTDKHTPNKEDCGIVRVPETEEVEGEETTVPTNTKDDTPENVEENETRRRKYTRLKLSYDAKTGTFKPIFVSKAVAWDSAKIERMNQKLSEVTKTIYGADDVQASLPNRTEVLRRNITNLIDDLYPNRLFDVEPVIKDQVNGHDLRNPFKQSFKQEGGVGRQDLHRSVYNALMPSDAEYGLSGDDLTADAKHFSLLKWVDNALFNYSIPNEYVIEGTTKYNTELVANHSAGNLNAGGAFINEDFVSTKVVRLLTCKLVTDETGNEKLGSYKNAVSKTDLLADLLGLRYAYLGSKVLADNMWLNTNTLNLAKDTRIAENGAIGEAYLKELQYTDREVIEKDGNVSGVIKQTKENASAEIQRASNVDFVVSRKQKSVMERLSTIESYLDANAKATKALEDSFMDGSTFERFNDGDGDARWNLRFEKASPIKANEELSKKLNDIQLQRIFDLDISDSESEDNDHVLTHNREVWKEIAKLYDVSKSSYHVGKVENENNAWNFALTEEVGYYEIYGKRKVYIKEGRYTGIFSEDKTYYVVYYNNLNEDEFDEKGEFTKNVIFIKSKHAPSTSEELNSFVSTGDNTTASSIEFTGKGYQNQTEQVMYKTLSNILSDMFKPNELPGESDANRLAVEDTLKYIPTPENRPLLYYMSLREHPQGDVYLSAKKINPTYLFGGTWKLHEQKAFLAVGRPGTTDEKLTYNFKNTYPTKVGQGDGAVTWYDDYYTTSVTKNDDWGVKGYVSEVRDDHDYDVEKIEFETVTNSSTKTLKTTSFYVWERLWEDYRQSEAYPYIYVQDSAIQGTIVNG